MNLPLISRLLLLGSSGVLALACVAHAQKPGTVAPPSPAQGRAAPAAPAPALARPGASAPQAPADTPQTAALFEATCSGCHELSQSTSQSMDRAGWSATIERMIGYGAALTPVQADQLATYLAATHGPARSGSGG